MAFPKCYLSVTFFQGEEGDAGPQGNKGTKGDKVRNTKTDDKAMLKYFANHRLQCDWLLVLES